MPSQEACLADVDAPLMERGVALIARVVAQRDGQIELERLVTLEMAEKMRREAEADSGVEQGQMARVQKAMEPKTQNPSSQAEQKANLGRNRA